MRSTTIVVVVESELHIAPFRNGAVADALEERGGDDHRKPPRAFRTMDIVTGIATAEPVTIRAITTIISIRLNPNADVRQTVNENPDWV